jgi:hypothetical protein
VKHLPHDLETGHTLEINLAMLTGFVNWPGRLFAGLSSLPTTVWMQRSSSPTHVLTARSNATGSIARMDDVLESLGECDLTTHINFTRLIDEATRHGLKQREYDLQGRVLGRMAMPWLQSLEGLPPDAATMRQFQSLTHPAFMGRSFRCLILEKPAR